MYGRRKPAAPPKQPAKNYAVWLLSRRDYSAAQLSDKMVARGYPQEEVAEALAFVQDHRFQDDERFAQAKVQTSGRRLGNRRLRAELSDAGIAAETAEAQMADLESEETRACELVVKFAGLALDEKLKAKVWRFLAYRGFGVSAIQAAWRQLKLAANDRPA